MTMGGMNIALPERRRVTVQEEKGWQLWWIRGDSIGRERVTVVVDKR